MAAGDEKSAIPFERNASIPVRDGAAKSGEKLARRGECLRVLPVQQGRNAFAPLDKVRKLRHGIPTTKGAQSPQWRAIQRLFSWQG